MDKKKIRRAEKNFKNYLEEGKIKEASFNELIYNTYLRNARESLDVANHLFKNKKSSLWIIVSSYYSMFYMSCAYLYKIGYKPGDEIVHQVVNESLIVQARHKIKNYILKNYSKEKEKALVIVDNYLIDYGREKVKRAKFQYQTTKQIKEAKAKTSLNRAKEFLTLMEEILDQ